MIAMLSYHSCFRKLKTYLFILLYLTVTDIHNRYPLLLRWYFETRLPLKCTLTARNKKTCLDCKTNQVSFQ